MNSINSAGAFTLLESGANNLSILLSILIAIHAIAAAVLSVYAMHQAILLILFLKHRRQQNKAQRDAAQHPPPKPAVPFWEDTTLPSITVQLPLYNERYVAERVVKACAALEYPPGKLNIQVLDDSTDDTVHIVQQAVEEARANGVDIEIVRRRKRTGFKAGALAESTDSVRGELVAIFDADFIPPPDLFRRLIYEQRAFADPRTGFVQTRWGHLNRNESSITRAQAMVLDIHFLVEQPARCNSGLFMAFNGSGGIWRRECIIDAGGWQYDTLVEDLDLSYRAQLHGWHGRFLPEEAVPGELPGDILAYKLQQGRWARGTVQCVRKLFPRIVNAPRPWAHKLFAWLHLTGYVIHPLMLVMMITTPILLFYSAQLPEWLGLVGALSLAPIASMIVAQRVQRRSWGLTAMDVLPAMMFGIGIAFSNTVGMITGLMRNQTNEWIRTPKAVDQAHASVEANKPRTNLNGANGVNGSNGLNGKSTNGKPADAQANSYHIRGSWTMWVELALALYGIAALAWMLYLGYWLSALPTLLYVSGFLVVGLSQFARVYGRKPAPQVSHAAQTVYPVHHMNHHAAHHAAHTGMSKDAPEPVKERAQAPSN